MAADSEATLPALTEAVKRLTTDDRKRAFPGSRDEDRRGRQKALERARLDATYGWDASPISTARLSAEVWEAVKNEDWAGGLGGPEWNYDKYYQRTRGGSAGGVGFASPAAVGAALAHRKNGRLVRASSDRWRSDVRQRSALDRRAPSHSAARRHAQ